MCSGGGAGCCSAGGANGAGCEGGGVVDGRFRIVSEFTPQGDQPQAIAQLSDGIRNGLRNQTLLGVTGSGKTYTMAAVIAQVQRPTLVIAHNKILAAQLCSEFKEFFPHNSVEYFVSYYDYYQPEAYIPQSDTYIEKDAAVNEEIDKLRHSATSAILERRDVIVVASVSCIYGLGSPEDYRDLCLSLRPGMEKDRDEILRKLVQIRYMRNDVDFHRGTFRVRGDCIEILPASLVERAIRVELFGDEVERITEIDVITGEVLGERQHVAIFPASHYVTTEGKMQQAIRSIKAELAERLAELRNQGKLLEAQRLEQRTSYDLEMMQQLGYCNGIENYSRHFTDRRPGDPPFTLLDFFPEDFLTIIDESHVTLPQLRAMHAGDKSRKDALVEHGFRLPSAYDNRPLTFAEFEQKRGQIIFASATPGQYELQLSHRVVEQIVRPTGLVDPRVEVRPTADQIDDLLAEINRVVGRGYRVLVTTLTKRMAEGLTEYLREVGVKVRYMHSEVATIERMEIVRDLRLGQFDVLVGINLLREGLDLPEVALVAILDADKEGFLRSETSLVQTIGRAARNVDGYVIMYADRVTEAMRRAIDETQRRRDRQMVFNERHGITPQTVRKAVREVLEATRVAEQDQGAEAVTTFQGKRLADLRPDELPRAIARLREQMQEASKRLEFEQAAVLRDVIFELEERRYGAVRRS
ncbi:MAG TPA: excinuclease ABC subunit UvrB [Firmicutes bacterium]|nr:excinuclease ABC subunit UvrB [Bacillota bacterium]